jgi:hypothetical protein
VGFSVAHRPTLIAEKSHEIVQISCFLRRLDVDVILTSKIKHFEERQVVYPSYCACISYSAYEYVYKQRKVTSAIGKLLSERVIAPNQFREVGS